VITWQATPRAWAAVSQRNAPAPAHGAASGPAAVGNWPTGRAAGSSQAPAANPAPTVVRAHGLVHPATRAAPAASAAASPRAAPPPRALPPRKARHRDECQTLEQLPNIGQAMAADLRLLGIEQPRDLIGREPLVLFRELARRSGSRQDPCVLDTLMAAVDFMGGAEALPWWHYTPLRKSRHPAL
jgi:hypothetical protein